VGSARLLHAPGVAEVGRGPDRVVVATGDRCWRSANREAGASAEATWCLRSLVAAALSKRPRRHDSTTARSSAPATPRCCFRPGAGDLPIQRRPCSARKAAVICGPERARRVAASGQIG